MSVFSGVTIDAAHSSDLDDAIWVERDGEGWNVTVCIADVASAVPMGSEADSEARKLGYSRYYGRGPCRTMLPRALSELLSLQPGLDRAVLAFELNLSADLEVRELAWTQGCLQHLGRLSHHGASSLIDTGEGPVGEMLRLAWSLACGLMAKRRSNGALTFFSEEKGLVANEDGQLVSVGLGPVARPYVIVSELMILVNSAVPEEMASRGKSLLFRNHVGFPTAERTDIRTDTETAARGGEDAEEAILRLERLSGRASMSGQAIGHFGLNVAAYAWITSPIRRYADLVNQRLLIADLVGEEPTYGKSDLDALGEELSELAKVEGERRLQEFKAYAAAAAARNLRLAKFSHLGDTDFKAVIKAACENGVCPRALITEIRTRIDQNAFSSKNCGRVIAAQGSNLIPAKAAILAFLASNPQKTETVGLSLNLDVKWTAGKSGDSDRPWYHYAAAAVHNGIAYQTDFSTELTRRKAKLEAMRRLLTAISGLEDIHQIHRRGVPDNVDHSVLEQVVAPRPTIKDALNYKGLLLERCVRLKIAPPSFGLTMSGPKHQPKFTCVAVLQIGGEQISSASHMGGSRKRAEQLASKELVEAMALIPSEDSAAAVAPASPEEPKGALIKICSELHWSLPAFSASHDGPAHKPIFTVLASLHGHGQDLNAEASGLTKKAAEKLAAAALLNTLRTGLVTDSAVLHF
jgi:ribonuclease R